jgi:hypothetical protein
MKKAKPTKPSSEEYQRFEQFVKELVAVPKSELDKREAHTNVRNSQRRNGRLPNP